MLTTISDLIGLSVYTEGSIHVGTVSDVIIDTETYCVDSIFVDKPNPLLVEGSIAIGIPFRWIGAVGDIILLNHFPKYIRTGTKKDDKIKPKVQASEAQAEAANPA